MQVSCAIAVLGAAACFLAVSGCGPNTCPNPTFYVKAQQRIIPNQGCPPSGCAGYAAYPLDVQVYGIPSNASLPETVFNTYSGHTDDSTGLFPVSADSVVVPGPWVHEVWFPDYCPKPEGATVINWDADQWNDNIFEYLNVNMTNGQTFPWYCDSNTLPGGPPAGMSRFAIAGSIPSSITLPMVDPFTTTYGLPFMYVYSGANGNPVLYSTITASSVDPSGGSATFPLPSNMPQNVYAFVTYNQNSDGGHRPNAFNLYSVASSQTIPGNPFGVAAGGLTDKSTTCKMYPGLRGQPPYKVCTSSSAYNAFPVVSLYGQNQVFNGSTG